MSEENGFELFRQFFKLNLVITKIDITINVS